MGERYKLKITPLACRDIDRVLAYISGSLKNPGAAADLLEKIEEEIENIRQFPHSYPDCSYYFVPLENYRHAVVGSYALFFRVMEESHTVEVLRFLYTKMDFSKVPIQTD